MPHPAWAYIGGHPAPAPPLQVLHCLADGPADWAAFLHACLAVGQVRLRRAAHSPLCQQRMPGLPACRLPCGDHGRCSRWASTGANTLAERAPDPCCAGPRGRVCGAGPLGGARRRGLAGAAGACLGGEHWERRERLGLLSVGHAGHSTLISRSTQQGPRAAAGAAGGGQLCPGAWGWAPRVVPAQLPERGPLPSHPHLRWSGLAVLLEWPEPGSVMMGKPAAALTAAAAAPFSVLSAAPLCVLTASAACLLTCSSRPTAPLSSAHPPLLLPFALCHVPCAGCDRCRASGVWQVSRPHGPAGDDGAGHPAGAAAAPGWPGAAASRCSSGRRWRRRRGAGHAALLLPARGDRGEVH